MNPISGAPELRQTVGEVVQRTPVADLHTHLYPAEFGSLCLWGIDDLITYHYLVAELFRSSPVTPLEFWELPKPAQANLIWETLFVRNTPLSEATQGVVAVMTSLGLDPTKPDLSEARRFFEAQDLTEYTGRIMDLANVSELVMTNDPFNPREAAVWKRTEALPRRFHAALRLDPLINNWASTCQALDAEGFRCSGDLTPPTIDEVRRFLDMWIARMRPLYLAVSLPFDFTYGDDSLRTRILRDAVVPTALQHRLPLAMMIGVARQVNPALRDAGDSVGNAGIRHIERICLENPEVRFLVSMLSLENQHELCVAARKFSNMMPFGCWWFLNNPSLVTRITAQRLEMLGATFIPQHSDARVLDQLVYKWAHTRRAIAAALYDSYLRLMGDHYPLTRESIEHDVRRMFSGNFREWVGLSKRAGEEALG
jgi:hypothetical protein